MQKQESEVTPAVENIGPANDKCGRAPLFGRSEFPRDAVARIYKPCRSAMTSGRAQPKGWRLVFERRTAPVIEPLMGYTGGADTLTQVELDFPTAQAAIDYAERQGLAYAVQGSPAAEKFSVESSDADKRLQAGVRRGFAGATLWTGADGGGGVLCIADGRGRRSSSDSRRETRHRAKLGVERVSGRSRDGRGVPENARPTRLDEVEQALLALVQQRGIRP
ncbi:NADH dehydrogenase ubiquinone Fe-S protein 4 [Mesorhizobium sp. M0306]|uniref:NADH dehydrogenase ubiquinone Fe-S protein 4 n=1 Tax=Mesorhizobium sp. M0306 TaxID=2956932 RepID=UPI0033373BF9